MQSLRPGWDGSILVDLPEYPDLDSFGYQLGAVRALAFKGRYSQSGVSEDLQAYCIGMGMILGRAPLTKLRDRTVQDATWYYNVTEGNPYKTES